MTAIIVDPESMSAEVLAQLGATFTARATERRKVIAVEEAWSAYNTVSQITGWRWSGFKECGQIRKACEFLIAWQRFHPEQIASAMLEVALEVCSRWAGATEVVARESVAAGICDGRFALEGGEDGD
jgi:hypothetical protein